MLTAQPLSLVLNQRVFVFVVGYAKNGSDEQLQSIGLFVCILHAIIADASVLSFLSVLRINNLRVFNTCAGSTPAASTKLSISRCYLYTSTYAYTRIAKNSAESNFAK